MKSWFQTVAVFLVLLCAAGAGLRAQSTIIQRVLVKVNGEVFTQKDLEDKQIGALQQAGKGKLQGDALKKALADMMPDLLVQAIDDMLLTQRGRELGFNMSAEQFNEMIENIKKDNKMDDAELDAALKQENLTRDTLRGHLNQTYIIRTVQQREVLGHLQMTEEELRQYYDKHRDEFVTASTVTLRELLVAVPAPAVKPSVFSPALDDTAKEKVNALRERALKGEDFQTLIAEASDSQTKANGGLIGPINVTEMATGIRDAIEKMQAGEITQPFRTSRGYQIFKLESRTASIPQPFESVKDAIAQKVGETPPRRRDAEIPRQPPRAGDSSNGSAGTCRRCTKRLAERVK